MIETKFGVYVLGLMISMFHQTGETVPWIDSVIEASQAIANDCAARPIQGGGPEWCAAVEVVMTFHESRVNPEAVGDSKAAKGLFQVHAATLGRPVPDDVAGQVQAARELLDMSFRICRDKPLEDRLGWYAAGGNGCSRRLELSKFRLHQAARLLRANPWSG